MTELNPVIEKKDWTDKMWKVYEWLVEWINDDEKIVATIVGGGSYDYGMGIEEVDRKLYASDTDYREYIDSQRDNWVEDAALPGSGWWLVGSMI